ncbi:SPASM domain-containing protein [Candidatus Pacearchaeota archaeon]|nr:SPASM domain-containing protein [Candidatus Pacearchaeota archaeon]
MRLSKFTHVYECIYEENCYYLIRHSITNKSFFFTEKDFNKLVEDLKSKKETDEINILKQNHLLVQDSYSETKFVNYLKESNNLNKFDLELIYLIFNTSCNLRCKYCYVEGSAKLGFKNDSMNEKTFNKLMDYLNKLIQHQKRKNPLKNKLTFIYYGSEPLMSKNFFIKSLKIIQKICNENKITPDFQITTNGTLFDDAIIKAMKEFKVGVSISLDGEKKINDSMRITQSGRGSYDKIIIAINLLKKSKIPFGISCTISQHNINHLKENVDHFIKLGASSVGFNILLNARYSNIPLIPLTTLNNNLLEASKKVNDLGFYEDRIQRKVRAFNGIPRFKDCGGVGNQLVFFPNGDIGPCEAYLCNRKFNAGNIKTLKIEEIEKSPVLKYWTKRYPLNMEECLYCPALGICGGGCPFNAETISKKNIYQRDKPFCVHTEMVLNYLLKKSIEDKTGKKDPYIRDITFMYSDNLF